MMATEGQDPAEDTRSFTNTALERVSFANAWIRRDGDIRCKEQEAEHGEEHPGPDGLQGDQRGDSARVIP